MKPTVGLYARIVIGDRKYKIVRASFKKGKPIFSAPPIRYYLRYTDDQGKRCYDSFKQLDKALAARENLDRTRIGLAPVATPADSDHLTIAQAVLDFKERNKGRIHDWRSGGDYGLSPNSADLYRKAVEDFLSACNGVEAVYIDDLRDPQQGATILRGFKNWLRENVARRGGKGAYTDAKKFIIVGQFLIDHGIKMSKDKRCTLVDAGLLDWNEIPRVKKPKIMDVVYYTPADLNAMLAAADGVDEKSIYQPSDLRELLLTLLWTGMRDEELQHLEWSDINWKNGDGKGKITIQDKPKYDWRVKDHEKRILPMDEKLRKVLQERQRRLKKKSGLVFASSVDAPNQNFADHVGRLQRRAVNGGYTFSRPEAQTHILHNFRHTYATMMNVMNVPIRNIQYLLGHSDLATTERYLAFVENPEEVRKQFKAIDGLI